MQQRPSAKELFQKVNSALAAVRAGRYQFPLTKYLVDDLDSLEVADEEALIELVIRLLEEILSLGPQNCYAGGRPPQRSYEPEIREKELWAFAWPSHLLKRRMYLKFVLKKDVYLHVDCHEDRS